MRALALFGRTELGDDQYFYYRVRYEKVVIDFKIRVAPNGKIGALELFPVDDWSAAIQE